MYVAELCCLIHVMHFQIRHLQQHSDIHPWNTAKFCEIFFPCHSLPNPTSMTEIPVLESTYFVHICKQKHPIWNELDRLWTDMPSDYLLPATHLIMFNHSSNSVIDDNLYFVDLHHCTIWSIGAYTSEGASHRGLQWCHFMRNLWLCCRNWTKNVSNLVEIWKRPWYN